MAWVITKNNQGDEWYLRRGGHNKAIWTKDTDLAISYSSKKAADFVILLIRLKDAEAKHIII